MTSRGASVLPAVPPSDELLGSRVAALSASEQLDAGFIPLERPAW